MITIYEQFDTEKEAQEYRDNMLNRYHPLGYSTYIVIEKSKNSDKWIAHGSRAESCD